MELTIIKKNSGAYIDSREVAAFIGKRHSHLLRDIARYCEILINSTQPKFGLSDFFVRSAYFDATGRELLCYLITRKGAEIIAHKLTGEKGVLFTAAYVTRFHELEAAERKHETEKEKAPRLREFNVAVKNVLSGMTDTFASPDSVMDFLRNIYKPLGIKVAEEVYTPCFYTATDVAQIIGLYSETGRPHAHAVAAIISKLNIHESQMIVVPYGLVGVTYRYDIGVVSAVEDWLVENGFPREIPHLNFDYHVYYKREKSGLIDNGFYITFGNDNYTADELDELCDVYDDCNVCPASSACLGDDE